MNRFGLWAVQRNVYWDIYNNKNLIIILKVLLQTQYMVHSKTTLKNIRVPLYFIHKFISSNWFNCAYLNTGHTQNNYTVFQSKRIISSRDRHRWIYRPTDPNWCHILSSPDPTDRALRYIRTYVYLYILFIRLFLPILFKCGYTAQSPKNETVFKNVFLSWFLDERTWICRQPTLTVVMLCRHQISDDGGDATHLY